jgi:hypothetical protein
VLCPLVRVSAVCAEVYGSLGTRRKGLPSLHHPAGGNIFASDGFKVTVFVAIVLKDL